MPNVNGLPYPALSDPNNPPADFLALATAVDGKLTTLNGKFPVSVANGGTGATTVAGAQDNLGVGLVPITPSSVAVGSGSGSVASNGLVTYSGASYIQVNGAFTSAYKNYRIIAKWDPSAGQPGISMRAVAAGTPNTTANNYSTNGIQAYGNSLYAGWWESADPGRWFIGNPSATVKGINQSVIEILNDPTSSGGDLRKAMSFITTEYNGSTYRTIFGGGTYRANTAFDGFRITTDSGTISGEIRIYGYR